MKTLVVYSTLTGNTRKVAEAVLKGLPAGAEIFDVNEAPDPAGYDAVACGFWVDKGRNDAKAAAYMKRVTGKKVFTFFTLGAKPDSDHARRCAEMVPSFYGDGCEPLGVFWCQGAVDPKLIETMKKQFGAMRAQVEAMPDDDPKKAEMLQAVRAHGPSPENEARWAAAATHPDADDLAAATAAARAAFAERV